MEFRILGAIEAEDEGLTLDVGGPRERTLLARLLLSANRVVSADRLAEDLWSGDPPPHSMATLRVYISRLRRVLGGHAAALVTQAPGYRLNITDDQLDAARFERLVATADAQLTAGRAEAAANAERATAQAIWFEIKRATINMHAGDVVTLSTLHGSKGLEYLTVFLIGCEEGYLPHARVLDARATDGETPGSGEASLEEERRLFYVGVTRAREHLVLSRAKARVLRGKPTPRTPSRFLLDVPSDLLEELEVRDEAPTTAREAAGHAEAILAMLKGM